MFSAFVVGVDGGVCSIYINRHKNYSRRISIKLILKPTKYVETSLAFALSSQFSFRFSTKLFFASAFLQWQTKQLIKVGEDNKHVWLIYSSSPWSKLLLEGQDQLWRGFVLIEVWLTLVGTLINVKLCFEVTANLLFSPLSHLSRHNLLHGFLRIQKTSSVSSNFNFFLAKRIRANSAKIINWHWNLGRTIIHDD